MFTGNDRAGEGLMDETLLENVVFKGLLIGGTTPGVALTQILCVAIKLGLVELVAERPRTASELAEHSQCHEPSMRRLAKALVGCGVFARTGDAYSLGPTGPRLQKGTKDSLRAPLLGVADAWKVWGELEHSIRTGEPAFAKALGAREWEFLKANPESNQAFTEHMGRLAATKVAAAASYRFPEDGVVIDVGGRDGTLLAAVLTKNTSVRGILFDRPEMVAIAEENLRSCGLDQRSRVIGGDFFESVPEGGDTYVLSSVLHDWERDDCVRILKNVRRAMGTSSRLLLVEVVLPDDDSWSAGVMLDINMMVITGGRERTKSDWQSLVDESGFRLETVSPVGDYCILECLPA